MSRSVGLTTEDIARAVRVLRGHKVLLDEDLAALYDHSL